MSRPRKDEPESAAPVKIEAAFWRLLEEVGYSEITVRAANIPLHESIDASSVFRALQHLLYGIALIRCQFKRKRSNDLIQQSSRSDVILATCGYFASVQFIVNSKVKEIIK